MKKILRTVGVLEAISFLVLLGVAMPMKYYLGVPEATKVPGMVHGMLFLAYIGLVLQVSENEGWARKQFWLACIASVLPLGTLIFDFKFLRPFAVKQS